MDTKQKFALPVKRLASVLFAVFIVADLTLAIARVAGRHAQPAGCFIHVSAAGDPVIAAGGDIACDPDDAAFPWRSGQLELPAGSIHFQLTGKWRLCRGMAWETPSITAAATRLSCNPTPPAGGGEVHQPIGGGRPRVLYQRSTGCNSSNAARRVILNIWLAAGKSGQGYYSFNLGAWPPDRI